MEEHELDQSTVKSTRLVPVVYEKPAKNPIFFPALLVGLQAIFIVLLGLHADYGREPVAGHHEKVLTSTITYPNGTHQNFYTEPSAHRGIADFYSMFQDIHVMIFVGFGFLMTFLKRYGYVFGFRWRC